MSSRFENKYQFSYEGDLYDTVSVIVAKKEFPEGYLKSKGLFVFRISSIGKTKILIFCKSL